MAEPSWQELLRLRLSERNARESAFSSIIEQCTPFFYLFFTLHKMLKVLGCCDFVKTADLPNKRNCSRSGTHHFCARWALCGEIQVVLPYSFLAEKSEILTSRSSIYQCFLSPFHIPSNPVRAAYMTSLESQISSLRDELATVYKTQGQNAQRLLSMNETLREKEEAARIDSENVRKAREDAALLRRKVEQHNELMSEKDRTAQVCIVSFIRVTFTNPTHSL
jgi:autophagy-related protein 16-1